MPANSKYDNALSVAIPRWTLEFRDNICNVKPFLAAMRQLGGVAVEPGGSEIVMNLRYASIGAHVVNNPLDAVYDNLAAQANPSMSGEDDTVSAASYDWAEVYGRIILSERTLNKLRNDARRMGIYVRGVTQGAVEDIGRMLNNWVLANTGAGSETAIGGLPYYIADYATAVGSFGANTAKPLGGITNNNAAHFWNAYVVTSVGAITYAVLDKHLSNIFANTGETPRLAVMPAALYAKLKSSAVNLQALNQQGGKVTVGFNAIAYGDTLIVPDNACPSGTVFLINPNTMKVYVDANEPTVEQVPVRQPVRFYKILMHAQLATNGRKYNGKLLGVTE